MLLVTISRTFILNLQLNWSKRPFFNRRCVYFLAFNHLLFLNYGDKGKYIKTFFVGKTDSLFRDVSPHICKSSFLNSPSFFAYGNFFPKSILNVPGKEDLEMYSELSRTLNMELFVLNDFFKKLHLWCSTGLWIRLWNIQSFMNEKDCKGITVMAKPSI